MQCNSICVCASKASPTDKLIECHSTECSDGKFFHLACLGLKRRPDNSKTTWQCSACKKAKQLVKATTCTSYVSAPTKSTTDYSVVDHDSDDDDDDYDAVSITQVTVGAANKRSALAKLESDYNRLKCSYRKKIHRSRDFSGPPLAQHATSMLCLGNLYRYYTQAVTTGYVLFCESL